MTKDDREIVSAVRAALADKVGQERFDLWFGAGTRLDYDGRALRIGAPSQFFLEWIRTNFRRHIEDACCEVLGKCPPLEFHLDAGGQAKASDRFHAAGREQGRVEEAADGGAAALGRAEDAHGRDGAAESPAAIAAESTAPPPPVRQPRNVRGRRDQSAGHRLGRDGRPPAGPVDAADVPRTDQRGQDPSAGGHLDGGAERRTSV